MGLEGVTKSAANMKRTRVGYGLSREGRLSASTRFAGQCDAWLCFRK